MITSLKHDTAAAAIIDAFATHGCDVSDRFDLLNLHKTSGLGKRTKHGRDHLLQACATTKSTPLCVSDQSLLLSSVPSMAAFIRDPVLWE